MIQGTQIQYSMNYLIYTQMKLFFSLIFVLIQGYSFAQWPGFNRAHPVSCQSPAYNYTAQGYLENVFVIDNVPNYEDGYLSFGFGVLCHPDSCDYWTRTFSMKYNRNGEVTWWNRYDDEEVDESSHWFQDATFFNGNSGGMVLNHKNQIVSGFTNWTYTEFNHGVRDYLVKMDLDGEIVEQHLVDSTWADYIFKGIIEDFSDSTYVGYGWHRDSSDVVNGVIRRAFILKMDSLGNHIWQKNFPDVYTAFGLTKALDGGYWVESRIGVGECDAVNIGNTDAVVIKTDEFGNEEGRVQIGGQCGLEDAYVQEIEMDKIVVGGRVTPDVNPYADGYTYWGHYYTAEVEQLPNGQLSDPTNTKNYLESTMDGRFTDLHHLEDDSYMMVGYHWTFERTRAGFLMKLNSDRGSLWYKNYTHYEELFTAENQHDAWYYLNDSKPTPDGGFVCAGQIRQWFENPNPLLWTPWIFKVDSMGCVEPGCHNVDVSEIVIGLENAMNVYPNPVSDIVNIEFNLPPSVYGMNAELVVINMQGQEVVRQPLSPSSYASPVQIDVSSLIRGVYIVHWVDESRWYDSVKLVVER